MYKAFCALVLVIAAFSLAHAQHTIIEFDPPGSTFTTALGINSSGTIVGLYYDTQNVIHGFTRDSAGNFTIIDVPSAANGQYEGTKASAINDSGQVMGYFNPASSPTSVQGFIRDSSGGFTIVSVPGAGASQLLAMNNLGQTAGCTAQGLYCVYYGSADKGFVRGSSGTITTFSPVNAQATSPASMNVHGAVTGTYADSNGHLHGFVRASTGHITEFDLPAYVGSGEGTAPFCINDSGIVTGSYDDKVTLQRHGFIRDSKGSVSTFDVPGTGISTTSWAINSSGTIAGWYSDSVSYHGFIRASAGNITTFNAPHAAQTPGYGTVSQAINRTGQIAGFYWDANGVAHGFLRQ
jgi:hypothetical protein